MTWKERCVKHVGVSQGGYQRGEGIYDLRPAIWSKPAETTRVSASSSLARITVLVPSLVDPRHFTSSAEPECEGVSGSASARAQSTLGSEVPRSRACAL